MDSTHTLYNNHHAMNGIEGKRGLFPTKRSPANRKISTVPSQVLNMHKFILLKYIMYGLNKTWSPIPHLEIHLFLSLRLHIFYSLPHGAKCIK